MPGGPGEAEDRAFHVLLELAHGQVFEDPLLDLLEVVVVGVEDLAGPPQVEPVAAGLAPGEDRQPVEIGPDDRVLGRAGVHPGEPLELALRLGLHLRGRVGLLDPLPELADLGVLALALAQLVLDRLELLAEEMVALGLGELAADLLLDLGRELEDRELPRQVLPQPLQPGPDVDLAQQALLLLDRERQARGQQVGQPARLARVDRRDLELLGDLLALVDHPLEEPVHVVHQRVELDPLLDDLLARLDLGRSGRARSATTLDQPGPVLPLADDPGRAVGELEHLEDQPDADRREQVVHPGRVGLGMQLADQADHPLADHASSISRMPLGRLITSGTTVWGKTTSDRNGRSGSAADPHRLPLADGRPAR